MWVAAATVTMFSCPERRGDEEVLVSIASTQIRCHPEQRSAGIVQEMADYIEVGDEIWDIHDQKWSPVNKVEEVNPVELRFYMGDGTTISMEGDHLVFRMLRTVEYGTIMDPTAR